MSDSIEVIEAPVEIIEVVSKPTEIVEVISEGPPGPKGDPGDVNEIDLTPLMPKEFQFAGNAQVEEVNHNFDRLVTIGYFRNGIEVPIACEVIDSNNIRVSSVEMLTGKLIVF